MSLINTNGLVIFGPGSEWFWAMAQFVLVAVTIGGIYYQLRAQAAANTLQRMQFFIDQWESTAFSHDRLTTALRLRLGPSHSMESSMLSIAGFFETLGLLERRKHISRAEIFLLGRSIQMWWALLRPSIEGERARLKFNAYSEFERLDQIMARMDASLGERYELDDAMIPGILEDVVRLNLGDLVRAKALASHDIPNVEQPAAGGDARQSASSGPLTEPAAAD
jgi:hypothetical protein